MSAPAVLVVASSLDELAALVRDAVRDELAAHAPAASPGQLVDKRELARALGISPAGVDRLVRAGKIPHLVVGEVRRFDLGEVRKALAANMAPIPPAVTKTAPREVVPGVRLLSRRAG